MFLKDQSPLTLQPWGGRISAELKECHCRVLNLQTIAMNGECCL